MKALFHVPIYLPADAPNNRERAPDTGIPPHRDKVIHDSYQGNRNPFIDHPEWDEAIW